MARRGWELEDKKGAAEFHRLHPRALNALDQRNPSCLKAGLRPGERVLLRVPGVGSRWMDGSAAICPVLTWVSVLTPAAVL